MNEIKEKPRCYILGPMRGVLLYNFPAFSRTAGRLEEADYNPVNPARIDLENGFDPYDMPPDWDWNSLPEELSLQEIIKRDLEALQTCTHYVCLPGWQDSLGANAEKRVLDWKCAQRLDLESLQPIQSNQEPSPTETRITDPTTGGQKGSKLERFDLIPVYPLEELARTYGCGAKKYEDNNWRKGYSWSLSFAAMMRHAWQFWRGESIDKETGCHHLASAAWHCFTLMWFEKNHPGKDNRSDKTQLIQ